MGKLTKSLLMLILYKLAYIDVNAAACMFKLTCIRIGRYVRTKSVNAIPSSILTRLHPTNHYQHHHHYHHHHYYLQYVIRCFRTCLLPLISISKRLSSLLYLEMGCVAVPNNAVIPRYILHKRYGWPSVITYMHTTWLSSFPPTLFLSSNTAAIFHPLLIF